MHGVNRKTLLYVPKADHIVPKINSMPKTDHIVPKINSMPKTD